MPRNSMRVCILDDVQCLSTVERRALRAFVRAMLGDFPAEADEVTLCLCGNADIAKLNEKFLRRKGPTDVLSFPDGEKNPDGSRSLGDVVLSWEKLCEQAPRFDHTPKEELYKLVTHGMLHLLGYTHEDGDTRMEELERKYMRAASLRRPDRV